MELLKIKDCTTIQKTNCKNPRIHITQKGDVVLKVPYFYTDEQSLNLLTLHHEWISNNIEKINHNHYEIQNLLSNHKDEILFFGKWIKHQEAFGIDYLKKRLLEYLKMQIAIFEKEMNVQHNKISVRISKTRLGSCSNQNNLSFSLLLVFSPYALIDYVIIHELSHILHKNHSKNFWNFVKQFCPRCKEYRRELHQNTRLYIALLERILSEPSR